MKAFVDERACKGLAAASKSAIIRTHAYNPLSVSPKQFRTRSVCRVKVENVERNAHENHRPRVRVVRDAFVNCVAHGVGADSFAATVARASCDAANDFSV